MTEVPTPAPSPEAGAMPWARQTTQKDARATDRMRKTVQGLPSWEPLPPGEILVRRPRHSS
jgi:hypothetical protein